MTQDFKKKLCDAGCTRHGTGECGYDIRGIEQNCPYFNYILSGYMLMERELLVWANRAYESSMTFVTGDPKIDQIVQQTWLKVVKKIESL